MTPRRARIVCTLGPASRVPERVRALVRDVKPGDTLLLDDGNVRLEVVASDGRREVRCRVVEGGPISDRKGINLPGIAVSEPTLTAKDHEDLRLALELVWGVETFVVSPVTDTDAMVAQVDRALVAHGRGRSGDAVVIVAGTPPGAAGNTNTLRVHRLGGRH